VSGALGGLMGGDSSSGSSWLLSLLCLAGPLTFINNLAFIIFLLYSAYKWVTTADFWAGLRTKPNEFNEDDLMALEKSVEQTVRISLDEIGLNPDDLKPIQVTDNNRII
jgi:hypothetical protein